MKPNTKNRKPMDEEQETEFHEYLDKEDSDGTFGREAAKDESKEVKEGGEDWEVKPFRTVTGLKYSIVSHYDVIAKCDKEDDAILLAQSKNMYHILKKIVEWDGERIYIPHLSEAKEILLKATPKK